MATEDYQLVDNKTLLLYVMCKKYFKYKKKYLKLKMKSI